MPTKTKKTKTKTNGKRTTRPSQIHAKVSPDALAALNTMAGLEGTDIPTMLEALIWEGWKAGEYGRRAGRIIRAMQAMA